MPDLPQPLLASSVATVRDVLSALSHRHAHEVFLVDHELHLVGCIDGGSLCRALLDGAGIDDLAAPLAHPAPLVVDEAAGRADVLDLMRARMVETAPVVDETGRVLHLHLLEQLVGAAELPNWAVVMAGGRGRRLAPLTDEIPKPMVRVAGRPILERLLLHLVGGGIRTVFLAVNYRREQIEAHFGDGSAFGCEVRYLREAPERPLGSGGALGLLADMGHEPLHPLLVLNGDVVTDLRVRALLDDHAARRAAATLVVSEHVYEVPFGVVRGGPRGLERLVEKPAVRWRVNAGVYVLEPRLLHRIPRRRAFPITELFDDCLERGEPVNLWELDGEWQDIGRPAELARARGR